MPNKLRIALGISFALVLSACGHTGHALVCPKLPPPPASLMQPPNYEQKVRQILFTSEPAAMPKSADSKP